MNIAMPFSTEILEWLGYPKVKICLFVLTEFTNVTDTQTHTERERERETERQTPHDGIGRAYA